MTEDIIFEAQDYLTIENNGIKKRIIDLDSLRKRHSMGEIISFLKDYRGEKNRALKNLILIDKTQRRVDETVIVMFRLTMAIKLLEDGVNIDISHQGKEVKSFERSQQRAGESRTFHKRYSRRHHRPRSRKNGSNDEKNRPSRYPTQRAA